MPGCKNKIPTDMKNLNAIYDVKCDSLSDMMDKVAKMNIFFGHQSVGKNILEGIDYWSKECKVPIDIIYSKDFTNINLPAFVHFNVGQNLNPIDKINDFFTLVPKIKTDTPAFVFFKFCYIDVTASTDVDSIFNYYKEKLTSLKNSFPDKEIILFTVPYSSKESRIKTIARKILSRPGGHMDNINRAEFNNRVLEEMGSTFPIFDLALIESTLPNGKLNTFKFKGNTYPALCNEYTNDGGHLNAIGSKIVAYNLLTFLANDSLTTE